MKRERKRPISDVSMRFCMNTRKLMTVRTLSIDALRRAIGLSHGNVHRISHGETEIPLNSAVLICKYFDKSLDEMIFHDVQV